MEVERKLLWRCNGKVWRWRENLLFPNQQLYRKWTCLKGDISMDSRGGYAG